jgi:uncharacterized protein
MTEEERKLVSELFDRLATLEDAQRDSEAERLIRDGLRQAPNAPYALVQTVLVQDEALKRANARIRQLEGAVEGAAPERDTSFLGSMRDTVFGSRERRPSVPSVGPSATASGMSSAWRTGAQPMPAAPAPAPAAAAPMGPMGMGMGGSFLGTAASAAAGVIGGALLLDGIRSMMGSHGGAHAALDPGGASPWSSESASGDLSRQAGLDDIGRSGDARGTGLFDDSVADNRDVQGVSDDTDDASFSNDGGFDSDDGGGQDV